MVTKSEYENLLKQIKEHDHLYYVENKPSISDQEYDALFRKVEEIERANPDWVLKGKVASSVGSDLKEGFQQALHKYPMLSLANTYSLKEVEDFVKRLSKEIPEQELEFCCELKIDGLAISLTYEKGELTKALTRGDGKKGDIVTNNIKTISSLPQKLPETSLPSTIEFRGEVYMEKETFNQLNEQRELEGLDPWANPRNAAAGSLKLLDAKQAAQRKLSCFIYSLMTEQSDFFSSQYEAHQIIKNLSFPALPLIKKCKSIEELRDFFKEVERKRHELPFEIDGIVVKLNAIKGQNKLGFTGKNPRWAVAYKFAAAQAETTLKDISIQVGRTGVLTPVAELAPVALDGSTISRASLHNHEEISRKDIRIGDRVLIEKGGDVIPKVVSVQLEKRASHLTIWKPPSHCPACSTPVVQLEEEVAIRCPNKYCPEQRLRTLTYFVSKEAMDIEFMGTKVVEQLVEHKLVHKFADIYALNEENLASLEGFKEKSIKKLLDSIERSKKCSLARFIMALGIRYIGIQTAELIAEKFASLEALEKASKQDYEAIDGIGDKAAGELSEFFADQDNLEEIRLLLDQGVNPAVEQSSEKLEQNFESYTFVLTGTLEKYTRQEAGKQIKLRGGKVSSSISKKTSFLLCGKDPGSKLDKAKKLEVEVLSEESFEAMLNRK
ncbi:MAG: NAD-dependent DNA ligase LigA [Chlamydiales bacterium]|nr:NAD-dependent DNA ligase LigA [Chlamydiales bacterium]NCF70536.1 NAD-dependent DNA ligase LigA [Chlamydiales bacterium]